KTPAPGAWQGGVDPAMPHGQQVLGQVGGGRCPGGAVTVPRAALGATNGDFELFKTLVYAHTDAYPKVDAEMAAARTAALGAPAGGPPGPGPGRANAGPPLLRMGNFIPSRVSEGELRDIYDWSKDGIGLRPSL